jgi:TPR repeat protein
MKVLILNPSDDYLENLFRKAADKYRPEFIQDDWESMKHQLDQMEKPDRIPRSVMADKFIDLANEFTKTEPKEQVGAAIMFAAARYNAFEAFSKSSNLERDKDDAANWYAREYKRMLDANMDDMLESQH